MFCGVVWLLGSAVKFVIWSFAFYHVGSFFADVAL